MEGEKELKFWKTESTPTLKRSNTSDSLNSLSSSGSYLSSASSSSRVKRFLCDYDGCNKAFTRPSILTEHQQTFHQGIKPFTCDQCSSTFIKKSHLERHLFSHSEIKPFPCSSCNKGLTTKQQLKRHEITHTKSFICPYENCGETFYKHPQLRAHILSFHLEKLKCQYCDKNFQRPYRLKNHIAKHHNPDVENPYQCTFNACSQSFKTWSQLQAHTKADHPKIPCTICDKPCVGEIGLKMHMKVHDESLVVRNWKCNICGPENSFIRKIELIEHYNESHENQLPKELLVSEDIPSGNENDFPQVDDKAVTKRRKLDDKQALENEENLEVYLNAGNNSMSLLLNTVGRKLKCHYEGCHRTFKTKERFDKHIGKHKIHQLKLKIAEEKK